MKKTFILAVFLGIVSSLFLLYSNTYRTTPRIVFCNVGQGDATYIRLPTGEDLLIDTGPNARVLSCLDRELPYFDRSLELVFLTHVDRDHSGGLESIAKNYLIRQTLASTYFTNTKIASAQLVQGDSIVINSTNITVLWPPSNLIVHSKKDIATNNTALVLQIMVGSKEILLLSDVDISQGERALSNKTHQQTILKISHHGSKFGTSKKLLRLADPAIAIISVGSKNSYGHPHPSVTGLLKDLNIPIKRTDRDGNVTIPLE